MNSTGIIIRIACVLLFLVGIFLVKAVNLKAEYRFRQLFSPVLAIVVSIAFVVVCNMYLSSISTGIEQTTSSASFASGVNNLLGSDLLTFVLVNFALFVVFALLKALVAHVTNSAHKLYDEHLESLFGRFYFYDGEYQKWFLRETSVGLRRLFKYFTVTAVVLATLLFTGTIFAINMSNPSDLPSKILCTIFEHPVYYAGVIVVLIGEFYYFLLGETKEEFETDITVDDEEEKRVFHYSTLKSALEHYFGDRILKSFSLGKRQYISESHDSYFNDLLESDDYNEKLAGTYFQTLQENGLVGDVDKSNFDEISHDFAEGTIRLLQGKSVLFSSPFYYDYLPYIALPLTSQLMRNKKVLVVYGESNTYSEIEQFINDSLTFVTNIEEMWAVGKWAEKEGEKDPDITLASFTDLCEYTTIEKHKESLAQTSFVIVVDPSSLIATYQIGLSFLSDFLCQGAEVTYCIFDKNSDDLLDSLSHALRINILEVGSTEYCPSASVGMLWKVDGEFLQHRLFPDVAHYMGVGSEIALVALKNQVDKVIWAGNSAIPLYDQRWILGQYYGEIFKFAELPQEQSQIDESFEFESEKWSIRKNSNRFIIAEDETFNLFETYRQFATRGSKETFVNVLSSNYLLRDYMVANAKLFMNDPKAIPSFSPDYSKSARNAIFAIVMMLVQKPEGLDEEIIRTRLHYAGVLDSKDVFGTTKNLIESYLVPVVSDGEQQDNEYLYVVEKNEFSKKELNLVTKRYYCLKRDTIFAEYFRDLRNVPVVSEMPDGTIQTLGAHLYGHVYQYILPGQFITIQGKYYEVVRISSENGVLLSRAADHFDRRHYYRQLRKYTLESWKNYKLLGDLYTLNGISVAKGFADFSAETIGYLDMEDYGNFETAKTVQMSNIPTRHFHNKETLKITLVGADEKTYATLAVVLNEALKTFYPKDYMYLSVLLEKGPKAEEEEALFDQKSFEQDEVINILNEFENKSESEPGPALYIIEDSIIDIGLLSSFERNLNRILQICWDYLDWHEMMLNGYTEDQEIYDVSRVPRITIEEKKECLIKRIIKAIKKAFSGEKEKPEEAKEENKEVANG